MLPPKKITLLPKVTDLLPILQIAKTNKKWSFSNVDFSFAAGFRGLKL
jgi:hypothetical protein